MSIRKWHTTVQEHCLNVRCHADGAYERRCNVKDALTQQRENHGKNERNNKTRNNNGTSNIVKVERKVSCTTGY